MLILLPPSEGKDAPARGRPLDLDRLGFADLNPHRRRVIDALRRLCAREPERAAEVLGLGVTQHAEVDLNARLLQAPAAPASRVYAGVLFEALGHATLSEQARRRVNRWVAVQSSLFGLVGLTDRIPAYRLSGDVTLPGIGRVARAWREPLQRAEPAAHRRGLVLDLRSSVYASFWRPRRHTVALRVLQEREGRRTVVSHHNKATKGHIVRALVEDGASPRGADELGEHLTGLGWHAEVTGPARLDVVVEAI